MRVIALFAIACGCLFIYGFLAPQMRLSAIADKRDYMVMVTDTSADESYFWVVVEGCSAEHTDDGVLCGTGWYGRSDREWWTGRKQTPVPFRDAPRGALLRFEAVVMDRLGKRLASASFITSRPLR